jgi:hypothetical protein
MIRNYAPRLEGEKKRNGLETIVSPVDKVPLPVRGNKSQ